MMPCSFVGKIIAVEYFLKAYVRHDAWNEFGEGKFVVLPIQITHPYVELKFQEPYYQFPAEAAAIFAALAENPAATI